MNTATPNFIADGVAIDQCPAIILKAQAVLQHEQSSMDIVQTETVPTARTSQIMIYEASTKLGKRGEFCHIRVARSKSNEDKALNFKVAEMKPAAHAV